MFRFRYWNDGGGGTGGAAQESVMIPPNPEAYGGFWGDTEEGAEAPPEGDMEALRSKAALADEYGPVLDYLKSQGLPNADAVHNHLAQQQATQQQQAAWEQTAGALHQQYQHLVDQGQLTPEAAEALYYRDLELMQLRHTTSQYHSMMQNDQANRDLDTALQQMPLLAGRGEMGRAVVATLSAASGLPVSQTAALVNGLLTEAVQQGAAEDAARYTSYGGLPTPMAPTGGSSPAGASGYPLGGGNENADWLTLLGIRKR